MKRLLVAIALVLGSFSPALAQKTIDQLSAGSALGGTEQLPMFQTANPAVTTTPAAIDTYITSTANTWSAAQTFTNSDILLLGSSTGATTFTSANAGASNFTLTFPAATDTLTGKATTDILTNKTYDTAGTGNVFKINGTSITAISGNTATVGSASGAFTSGNCVKTDANHNLIDAATTCGGTTAPGGANTNIQFNNSSAFGGDSSFTYAGAGGVVTLTPAANTAQPMLITGGSTTGSGTGALGLSVVGTLNTTGIVDGAVLFANITNTASNAASRFLEFKGASTAQFSIDFLGNVYLGNSGNQSTINWTGPSTNTNISGVNGKLVVSGSTTINIDATNQLINWIGSSGAKAFLGLDGVSTNNILAQTNGTNAQAFRVYNTFTNASNYERGALDWITNSNVLTIGTQKAGTGSTRNIEFVIGGTNKMDYGVTTSATWTLQDNVNAPGLAALSANTTAYVCWTTSTGALSEDSTTCLASLRKLKDNINPFDGATGKLLALRPSTFTWKKPLDRNQQGTQLGFIAEDVEQVDTKLASYSHDGSLHGWQEEGMIALLVRGFQEQQVEIEQLKRRAAR